MIVRPLLGVADGVSTVRHLLDKVYADKASLQLEVFMMSPQGDTDPETSSLMIERWKRRDEKHHSTKALLQAKRVSISRAHILFSLWEPARSMRLTILADINGRTCESEFYQHFLQ
jgi:hypothetical protein